MHMKGHSSIALLSAALVDFILEPISTYQLLLSSSTNFTVALKRDLPESSFEVGGGNVLSRYAAPIKALVVKRLGMFQLTTDSIGHTTTVLLPYRLVSWLVFSRQPFQYMTYYYHHRPTLPLLSRDILPSNPSGCRGLRFGVLRFTN